MTDPISPPPSRPVLLTIGMGLSFFAGPLFLLGALGAAAGLVDTSSFRNLPSWSFPVWGMAMLVLGGLLLAIALGIRRRAPWSRHLIIAFWVFLAGLSVWSLAAYGKADFLWLPCLAFAVWYLYWRKGVVRYFGHAA
jgi:hypothetical protein